MYVWPVPLMFVPVEDRCSYDQRQPGHKDGSLISGANPAGFPPACWTVPVDPLYLTGSEGHQCVFLCVSD